MSYGYLNNAIMICTIRNEILAKIEDRASFLEYLIKEYPRLLEEWTEKNDKEFEKEAKEEADGDYEVYSSIYNSFLSAFDDIENREDMFYKAMLLMTYSYYEGALAFFCKKKQTEDIVDAICRTNHFELSEQARDAKFIVQSDIRIIRNQLTHNNIQAKGNKEALNRICKKWTEIHISNGEITITGADFILDALKKETLILKELCEKLDYEHKKIGYK